MRPTHPEAIETFAVSNMSLQDAMAAHLQYLQNMHVLLDETTFKQCLETAKANLQNHSDNEMARGLGESIGSVRFGIAWLGQDGLAEIASLRPNG